MKQTIILSLTALTFGLVAFTSALHAESLTVDEQLAKFQRSEPGVYGRSPIYDIGNNVERSANATPMADGTMNCADMPCCKNMKMDKQKCEAMMKENMTNSKGGMVKCADMPCCKNMGMDMQGCEKMMSK